MLSAAVTQQAEQKIQSCIQQANHYFSENYTTPTLSLKLRGKCAGKAYLELWEVRLNPILFHENQNEFLNQVIPHEIAHLIAFKRYGRVRPHGKEWKAIMWDVFQLEPTTTHRFNVSSVQGKRYSYHCGCQSHDLTIRRHNKIVRGQANYLCVRCQQELQFTGVTQK
ncbi:SprT family zinc-dependent metalloprotease [Vibrio sp. RC27]